MNNSFKPTLCTRLILTLAALVVCFGCSPKPSPEVESFLAKQRFDSEFSNPEVTAWERQNFNLQKKEMWQTKSRDEVPNWTDAYYRYTIVKESYQSDHEASERLKRLHDKPPGLSPDDNKAFPLREGFSFKNVVFVVSCQVSMFHEHMKNFTRGLERDVVDSASQKS